MVVVRAYQNILFMCCCNGNNNNIDDDDNGHNVKTISCFAWKTSSLHVKFDPEIVNSTYLILTKEKERERKEVVNCEWWKIEFRLHCILKFQRICYFLHVHLDLLALIYYQYWTFSSFSRIQIHPVFWKCIGFVDCWDKYL